MSALVARQRQFARRPAETATDRLVALGDRAFIILTMVSIALWFLMSEMFLTNIGISYAEGGGSPLEKIHPGTWLALATLLFMGMRHGNPLRLLDLIVSNRGLAIFLASWLLLFAWVTIVMKTPFSPLIDTFMAAIVAFLLMDELGERDLRRIAVMIHLIMTANALLGLYEYLSGWRLTPYAIGSITIEGDWRSTAILGHPLANASMTGSYVVALALGGGRDLPRVFLPAAMGLQLIAMIAFGGRSSLVNALAIIAIIGAWRLIGILRGARFSRLGAALVFLMAPLAVAALAVVADAGFFDQFILRFSSDLGSAKARVVMLEFFRIIPLGDIIVGPDQTYVSSLQSLEGIEFGIESFWVGFIFAHGAIMASVFFLGLFAFCWQLALRTRPETWVLLLFFFLVATTSVSLSVKTCSFAMFVAFTLSTMRAPAPDAPGTRP